MRKNMQKIAKTQQYCAKRRKNVQQIACKPKILAHMEKLALLASPASPSFCISGKVCLGSKSEE